jgi:hypothetical protein
VLDNVKCACYLFATLGCCCGAEVIILLFVLASVLLCIVSGKYHRRLILQTLPSRVVIAKCHLSLLRERGGAVMGQMTVQRPDLSGEGRVLTRCTAPFSYLYGTPAARREIKNHDCREG